MTINGGIGNMSRGGGHLNACPGGLEGIIEACPGGRGTTQKLVQLGGWNKTEACPGGIYKSVLGRWRYNISLSRGAFIYCPGGRGGTFAILSSVGVYG